MAALSGSKKALLHLLGADPSSQRMS
jgi:hypothetical protein